MWCKEWDDFDLTRWRWSYGSDLPGDWEFVLDWWDHGKAAKRGFYIHDELRVL